MGIISQKLPKNLLTSDISKPSQWLVDFFSGGSRSNAGVAINDETILRASAIFNGLTILSNAIAMLPFDLMQKIGERRRRQATETPLYNILHNSPNPEMTAFTWRRVIQLHCVLKGNGYSEIERNNAGQVIGLWPLNPARTWPERDKTTGKVIYKVVLPDGKQVILPADRVFHIMGLSNNGLYGLDLVGLMRETAGLGLAEEEYSARFFSNNAMPSGVIEAPVGVAFKTPDGSERLRKDWEKAYGGLSNSQRIAILEQGFSFKQIGIDPEKSQLLEARKFTVTEIARWLNLPPHMIKDLTRSTNNNIEFQGIEFVTHSIEPYAVNWEQTVWWKLLTKLQQRENYYAKLQMNALLRADSKTRAEYYGKMFGVGAFSSNDIRALEDQDAVEGGDTYYVPANMMKLGSESPNINTKGGENGNGQS